ncbi:MAG: AarF/ABC1/UbiB kinase family protein [Solirubrobacteraceae bacterium]|nr:AarF/ABC1/UbiB kinase family protein [Solirubrobacteraceae bacterium]
MARGLNTSRFGRAAKLGGLAAGAGARQLGTKAANVVRDEDASAAANKRAALETADRMVTVLGTMRGAAMKIGQTLSVIDIGAFEDDEVRAEFQAKLAKLQSMAPTVSFDQMRKVIEDDLDAPLDAVFSTFDEEPIAAASIGQVYRATLLDGRDVAVKVQYPGIKEVVRADLKNVRLVLKVAARFSPGMNTKEVADEVIERITDELDYELEADNHKSIARAFADHPFVVVPDVITKLCSERVIVTEFVEARRFDEITDLPAEERNRYGEILFRFYVNGPYRTRLLNGDPHPGNTLFLEDGRVAFLDFGFFRRQTKEEVETSRRVLEAVYAEDARALWELSVEQDIIKADESLIDPLMEKYRAATWWFMKDEDVTLASSDVSRIVVEHADMKDGFGDIQMPADQVTTLRAFGLVLGVLGQLRATNNWHRIGREVVFGDAPETELGREEAAWLEGGAVAAPVA